MRLQLRTGDKAVLIGVAAIAVYEMKVRDDDDLISRRFSAYRKTPVGRLLVDTAVLVTALHLTEYVSPEHDLFHLLMGVVRRSAIPPPPDPNAQKD